MSLFDGQNLLEAGVSTGVFAGADYLLKQRRIDPIRLGQQAAATLAAPYIRNTITNAGFSINASADLMDPAITGLTFAAINKVRGRPINPRDILISAGSAFAARAGKDLVTGKSITFSGKSIAPPSVV